jgi:hypothetical protein
MSILHLPPPHIASLWLHGMFLPDPTQPTDTVTSTCSVARRWLLESINRITDLPLRAKNSIGRDLAHHSRWTARTTRTPHPSSRPCHDAIPLPTELTSGYQEIMLDIPTSCIAIGFYTRSLHNNVNSTRSVRHRPTHRSPPFTNETGIAESLVPSRSFDSPNLSSPDQTSLPPVP